MCNLYRLSSPADAIRALFKATGADAPNLPEHARIFPDQAAPVVICEGSERRLVRMLWGVPPPAGVARPITNVRNLASPFWRGLLASPRQRALVPVSAFCEWSAAADPATGRKRQHWFAVREAPLFAFAGVWRSGAGDAPPRFAFLTCAPNALVGAVHPKAMPVILAGDAADRWLNGDPAAGFQQPFADDRMVELPHDAAP